MVPIVGCGNFAAHGGLRRGLRVIGAAVLLGGAAAVAAGAENRPGVRATWTEVNSLEELRRHASEPGARIRLRPGEYRVESAPTRHFFALTGRGSKWDLTGVRLIVDTKLFRQFGPAKGPEPYYCVFLLAGDDIEFFGARIETAGDLPGLQSKNKIFSVTGSRVVLRDVELITAGSSPWGYGSLYGISGGDVRKMNGIRVGWPARDVQVLRCRVQMRAMGHGIFVQGASGTVIRDCVVEGLLRPTEDILAECAGYAFERSFLAKGRNYSEGVRLGPKGEILPGEMVALSEDGIRMYADGGSGRPTGPTVIEHCRVTRMRRGICTALGPAADRIVDCEVRECVTAGFTVGSGDVVEQGRADAKYGEALCVPGGGARGAVAEVTLLDSRQGRANDLVAVINGRDHRIRLRAESDDFIPPGWRIEMASRSGYAFYQRRTPGAERIELRNETTAAVVLGDDAVSNGVRSRGAVTGREEVRSRNRIVVAPGNP
jgi:hypothetical protein